MFISVVCILCCSALCVAQHSLPYVKVGMMTVLYQTNFDIWQRMLGDTSLGYTQSRAAEDAHNRDEHANMDSGQNKERPNQKLNALSSSNNSFTLKKMTQV